MNELVTFTDYAILEPRYFIERITKEIDKRDFPGLTNNNRGTVRVSSDHPAIEAVRMVVANEGMQIADAVGEVVPSIAVSEAKESEAVYTKGDSIAKNFLFTKDHLANLKSASGSQRFLDTIIADSQISLLENILNTYPDGVAAQVNVYRVPSFTNIGLWCRTGGEAELLYPIVRSILYASKIDMLRRGAAKITISANRGIYMAELDIYGDEFTLNYVNQFRNIIVYDSPGNLKLLENDAEVNVLGEYKARGESDEKYTEWPPNE